VTASSGASDLAALPLEDVQCRLSCDAGGLSAAEAARRFGVYGANEIVEKARNPVLEFAGYFWAPIPWMIEVALVLSVLVRHWTDAVIIGVLLAMNGVVAFVEEHQAATAIAALKARLAATARVLRDGAWTSVATRDVVPGDVLRIRLGDVIPADTRLLDDVQVQVDQSALTGESLPVTRGRGGVLYSGAVITRGEGDALVYATGADSFFGRTTALVQGAGVVSHFQRAVLRIAHYLIVIAVALVGVTTAVSLLRGNPVLETLEFALVVTIASVPVALPAVLSVTMAVGARQLARQQAVVRHLPAVEELGGIDVLCSDKTGTLTQNLLAVADPWLAPGVQVEDLFAAAALASRAEDQDLIDLAVLSAADAHHAVDPRARVEEFAPFDPVTKRTQALVRAEDGTPIRVSKGAPQVIAELAGEDPAVGPAQAQVTEFAVHGYRSLAVARAATDGPWRLLGLLPLADPPRADSAATIAAARELGLQVKMVTGDQVAIGAQIAGQIGLGQRILPATDLDPAQPGQDRSSETDPADESERRRLVDLVEGADGFGQVFPEHKYRIVQVLQEHGHIVGMTGDGVNDAPALKQADAGIAVSGATDAARTAADVVLLAPGLSVIVDAVRLAREIFARMTSYTIYRITETIRVLLLISLAIVVMNFFPVTAIMIVLLAVLNDGAILSIAYDRVRGSSRPAAWDLRSVLVLATALGAMGVAETFLLFTLADTLFGLDRDVIRTLIYLKLSVSGHLTIFVTRTRGPFWSRPAPAPLLLGAVIGTQALATLIAGLGLLMTPLGWGWVAIVWAYSLFWFLIEDRVKLTTYAWLERNNKWRNQHVTQGRSAPSP
jgi:H+-transporting ATPase